MARCYKALGFLPIGLKIDENLKNSLQKLKKTEKNKEIGLIIKALDQRNKSNEFELNQLLKFQELKKWFNHEKVNSKRIASYDSIEVNLSELKQEFQQNAQTNWVNPDSFYSNSSPKFNSIDQLKDTLAIKKNKSSGLQLTSRSKSKKLFHQTPKEKITENTLFKEGSPLVRTKKKNLNLLKLNKIMDNSGKKEKPYVSKFLMKEKKKNSIARMNNPIRSIEPKNVFISNKDKRKKKKKERGVLAKIFGDWLCCASERN
jgi:hypothetical protein